MVVDAVGQVVRCERCGTEIPIPLGSVRWVGGVSYLFCREHARCRPGPIDRNPQGEQAWMSTPVPRSQRKYLTDGIPEGGAIELLVASRNESAADRATPGANTHGQTGTEADKGSQESDAQHAGQSGRTQSPKRPESRPGTVARQAGRCAAKGGG